MSKKEDIIQALNAGFKMRLDSDSEVHKGIQVLPQTEEGTSIWAKLLSDGYIEPFQVLWAVQKSNPKTKNEWLAVRVTTKRGVFFFNLKDRDDKALFQQFGDKFNEVERSIECPF